MPRIDAEHCHVAVRARQKLTAGQAREARLSIETTAATARRFGVSHEVVRKLRCGITYGPLKPDEEQTRRVRSGEDLPPVAPLDNPVNQLVICHLPPGYSFACMPEMDFAESKDAVHECEHGRLPRDRTEPCGCWPSEIDRRGRQGLAGPKVTQVVYADDQFGSWTVLVDAAGALARVPCRCMCGRIQRIRVNDLFRGTSWRCRSCAHRRPGVRELKEAA